MKKIASYHILLYSVGVSLLCAFSHPLRAQQATEFRNLGAEVNSTEDDYAGVLSSSNDTLIFSTSRPIRGKLRKTLNAELVQIASQHVKRCEPRDWKQATLFDSGYLQGYHLNLNEGTFTISHDRTFAILAAERRIGASAQSAYQDLYQVALDAAGHPNGAPQSLSLANEPLAWDSQPALSEDDKTLFFSSDRKRQDTSRDFDVYVAHRMPDGSWSRAENLGPQINTGGNDVSPFVRGDTLYFASDGNPDGRRPGPEEGKRDIFKTVISYNGNIPTFTNPVRLPAPFNSPGNDEFPFISENGRYFVLTSDREGGIGKRDLYMACLYTPPMVALRGTVSQRFDGDNDASHSQPIPATIVIEDKTMGTRTSVASDASGHYSARLVADREYQVYPDSLPCFRPPVKELVVTVIPDQDTVHVRDFEYLNIRQRIGLRTDTVVPFFVTGYWYPNTPKNYQKLFERRKDIEHKAYYIYQIWKDPTETDGVDQSVDYQKTSEIVAQILDRSIYQPVKAMLAKMYASPCNDSGLLLRIGVTGFCDERRLEKGPFRDETIVVDGESLDSSMQMNHDGCSSPGNTYLSRSRAFFTAKTVDQDLSEISDAYRRMKQEGRVVFSCAGNGVDRVDKRRAFKRRVDIQVALVHAEEANEVRQKFPFVNSKLSALK